MIMTLSARDPAQRFAIAAVAAVAFLACWLSMAVGQDLLDAEPAGPITPFSFIIAAN